MCWIRPGWEQIGFEQVYIWIVPGHSPNKLVSCTPPTNSNNKHHFSPWLSSFFTNVFEKSRQIDGSATCCFLVHNLAMFVRSQRHGITRRCCCWLQFLTSPLKSGKESWLFAFIWCMGSKHHALCLVLFLKHWRQKSKRRKAKKQFAINKWKSCWEYQWLPPYPKVTQKWCVCVWLKVKLTLAPFRNPYTLFSTYIAWVLLWSLECLEFIKFQNGHSDNWL